MELSHIDRAGNARMVDVSEKAETDRTAVAECSVLMNGTTLEAILGGNVPKGDVFTTAKIAGIQAAKGTSGLIPMCHNIPLSSVEMSFERIPDGSGIKITSVCRAHAKTGVEMEALTSCAVAALTVYDMAKAVDRGMVIGDLRLLEKTGGKSGHFVRQI